MQARPAAGPRLTAARAIASLALAAGLGLAACTDLGAPPPRAPPGPGPTATFDGRYTGSIRVTGASTSMNPQQCETAPRLDFTVTNGQFGLTTAQPQLTATTSYTAQILADGSITGISNQTGGTIRGKAEGTRLNGEIFGLLCYYAFTANRR
jgi:hypothetical protein